MEAGEGVPGPLQDEPGAAGPLRSLAAPAFGFFALLTVNFLFYGSVTQAYDLPLGVWFSQICLFLLPAVAFARAFNLRPMRYLRLDVGIPASLVALVFLASVANYFFAAAGMGFLDLVLPESWHIVDVELVLGKETGLRLWVVLAGVALLAPLCEEVAFRGAIQQPLISRYGVVRGLLITAVAFSALHVDPIGFLPRIELGLFFGWLVWRTGSLWAPILAHAINNGTAAVLFLAVDGAGGLEPTGEEVEPAVLAYVMAAGALFLVPLVLALHRATEARAEAQEAHAVQPVEESLTIGLRPRSTAARVLTMLVAAAIVPVAVAVVALVISVATAG